jgi:hypothetical protein
MVERESLWSVVLSRIRQLGPHRRGKNQRWMDEQMKSCLVSIDYFLISLFYSILISKFVKYENQKSILVNIFDNL